MPEADAKHLNESILFYEERAIAWTQDVRSDKGSAAVRIFRINPYNRTSEVEDHLSPASGDDQFAFLKEITV